MCIVILWGYKFGYRLQSPASVPEREGSNPAKDGAFFIMFVIASRVVAKQSPPVTRGLLRSENRRPRNDELIIS